MRFKLFEKRDMRYSDHVPKLLNYIGMLFVPKKRSFVPSVLIYLKYMI